MESFLFLLESLGEGEGDLVWSGGGWCCSWKGWRVGGWVWCILVRVTEMICHNSDTREHPEVARGAEAAGGGGRVHDAGHPGPGPPHQLRHIVGDKVDHPLDVSSAGREG